MSSITFLVSGEEGPIEPAGRGIAAARETRGKVKQSVRVGVQRGGKDVSVKAVEGDDVVVVHLAGGASLTLHPESAQELFEAQQGASGARGAAGNGEVKVPAELRWLGLGAFITTGAGEGGACQAHGAEEAAPGRSMVGSVVAHAGHTAALQVSRTPRAT